MRPANAMGSCARRSRNGKTKWLSRPGLDRVSVHARRASSRRTVLPAQRTIGLVPHRTDYSLKCKWTIQELGLGRSWTVLSSEGRPHPFDKECGDVASSASISPSIDSIALIARSGPGTPGREAQSFFPTASCEHCGLQFLIVQNKPWIGDRESNIRAARQTGFQP